ncbi:hypothetical protein E2562_034610 [Oryza meyeriana var. granulata]|uniref:F-box domain-containing protein n=1 Tax=Oryza meyeriana var. granulata TaxID=110450 RepID=A0A6G1DS48_9ORYZ|nr:hypothetical protein E2562_034610 [Oryza meyeriana var. granulata]
METSASKSRPLWKVVESRESVARLGNPAKCSGAAGRTQQLSQSCAPFCSAASAETVRFREPLGWGLLRTLEALHPARAHAVTGMSPSHRHRKRRTAEAAPGKEADALISLPPDVLDGILTRLDLRDAVRTSALSRGGSPSCSSTSPSPSRRARRWPLFRCSGRLRSFSVYVDKLTARLAQDWILILSRRGVESLVLSSLTNNRFALHSSVFSFDRLTFLDLFACDIQPLPPSFAGFPHLKNLILDHVWFGCKRARSTNWRRSSKIPHCLRC